MCVLYIIQGLQQCASQVWKGEAVMQDSILQAEVSF